jgi:hypothetical protein
MLPIWLITALPLWLVIFIILYAIAALYVAVRYREVRKFLAGAFFVSSVQRPARHRSFHFVLTVPVFRLFQQTE